LGNENPSTDVTAVDFSVDSKQLLSLHQKNSNPAYSLIRQFSWSTGPYPFMTDVLEGAGRTGGHFDAKSVSAADCCQCCQCRPKILRFLTFRYRSLHRRNHVQTPQNTHNKPFLLGFSCICHQSRLGRINGTRPFGDGKKGRTFAALNVASCPFTMRTRSNIRK
jgi:hypothetical protein